MSEQNGNKDLCDIARLIRLNILEMAYRTKSSHIGSALSCADILTALFFSVMNIKSKDPIWPTRDRFILSKGHGCMALYSALALADFFPIKTLNQYGQNGTIIPGHATLNSLPGIEASTGSGGHGLPIGIGMAIALRNLGLLSRVFVLMGDGELEEGSVWEGVMFAAHHKLNNLTLIIDKNNLQIMGRTGDIIDLAPLDIKFTNFGWEAEIVDGHDLVQLTKKLNKPHLLPKVMIAETIKGRGISFMENRPEWHGKYPNDQEYLRAKKELGDQI